jgi:DNA-binding MarR family transcriptional regulator
METDNTIHLLAKVNALASDMILSELKKNGINGIVTSHGDIIVALLRNESLRMCELSKKIGKDASTVTALIKKLNKLGYTCILQDETDKRITRVGLTSEGKSLEGVFKSVSEKLFTTQYKDIAKEEIEVFRSVLKRMVINFSK